ncbi:MAG TPA: hypothetical protein VM529_23230, partial [Gemmata sp.]|nr:hypothetical protein [Gemmata sp.]
PPAAVPSFETEVMPLLTKAGCNQGACHGKGAGQNGFRLSLRGFAPELDHKWITREFDGRRVPIPTSSRITVARPPCAAFPSSTPIPAASRPAS